MKIKLIVLGSIFGLFSMSCKTESYKDRLLTQTEKEQITFDVDSITEFIVHQYKKSLEYAGKGDMIPRNSYKDGTIRLVPIEDWVSGFYAGTLWYIYELTGDTSWVAPARQWTEVLDPIKTYEGIHDIGFMIYCSYGNGYRLLKDNRYLPVLEQTSETLCKRFNPKIGTLLSWGNLADTVTQKYHNTIIDNMMNLELLMFSAKKFQKPYFSDIAVRHADNTIKCHFRPDYSTYHVVEFDKKTGEIVKRETHQGYDDNSDWARGQAWTIYGYSMMYRETKDEKYLEMSSRCADRFISHLPGDLIPYWDFDDPCIPDTYRDASAGAIAACGLFDLSKQVKDSVKSLRYYNIAVGLVNRLSSEDYLAKENYYKCLILHSVGHWQKKTEIDCNINYADYYYMEALLKALNLYDRKNENS